MVVSPLISDPRIGLMARRALINLTRLIRLIRCSRIGSNYLSFLTWHFWQKMMPVDDTVRVLDKFLKAVRVLDGIGHNEIGIVKVAKVALGVFSFELMPETQVVALIHQSKEIRSEGCA